MHAHLIPTTISNCNRIAIKRYFLYLAQLIRLLLRMYLHFWFNADLWIFLEREKTSKSAFKLVND